MITQIILKQHILERNIQFSKKDDQVLQISYASGNKKTCVAI